MGQLLRLLIVLFGVWLVLRLIRQSKPDQPPGPSSPAPPADMLRCEYCGVFVPRGEAVTARGHTYCSGDHADRDNN